MHPLISLNRGLRAIVLAVIAASLASATLAQDMSQLEARMRKAIESPGVRPTTPAPVAASTSPSTSSSSSSSNEPTQTGRNFDVDLSVFITTADSVASCSSRKSAFKQQNGAAVQSAAQMRGYAQQLQANAALKAQATAGFAPALEAALLQTRILDTACLNFASTSSAVAQGAKPGASASAGIQFAPPPTAPTRYELVAAVMRQVFNAGDLRPQSRAVRYATDIDMRARGGTPATLYTWLTAPNGTAKAFYKANFGLKYPEAVEPSATGNTPVAAGAESSEDAALNEQAADLSRTREALPALPEAAALVKQARQFSDNLDQVAKAMKTDGGWGDASTTPLAAIAESIRYLASGSPWSLQNLAGGGAVALNRQELQQVDDLIAASGAAADLQRMNTAMLQSVREVQPLAVVWKAWPDAPRVQLAAMGELPLNLPAFTDFGRETLNLASLDRGQRLVMVLKIANSLKKAQVFPAGSLPLDARINETLDAIQQAMGIDPKKAGKDGTRQVMSAGQSREFMKASGKYLKVASITRLNIDWIQSLGQLAGSLMPDSITGFHAQTGLSRTPSSWTIRKDAVIGLSLYVVPQVSGSSNLLTPQGLVAQAVDAVKTPFLGRIPAELGKRLESRTRDYLKTFVQAQAQQMMTRLNMSSGPLFGFMRSDRDTFPIAARSLEPVDINDRRLVNMSVVPAAAPEIALDNPGNFTVTGKQGGNVILRGYIHNADLLRYVKASPYLAMSVTVSERPTP
jgi:hypothetical protein